MDRISKGTVITIITTGTQGILEEDAVSPDQEVPVRFGREYSYLFGSDFDEESAILSFHAGDLRSEVGFSPENRARRLFNSSTFHHVWTLSGLFDPAAGHDCQCESCRAKATRRILVNILGCVCEFETCDDCAGNWHGKLVEYFPVKKRAA
jgi:hypothetical protein